MKEGMIYQLFAKACRESGCAIKPSNDLDVIYKFAELIIQEAASLTLNYKNESYYNGWLDYRDEIKRHFGIKDAPKT